MSLIKTTKLLSKNEFQMFLDQYDKLPSSQQLYMYGRKSFGYKTYKYFVKVTENEVKVYERM